MCDDVNSDCQSLIAKEPTCHGWMKIQRRIHEIASTLHLNRIERVAKSFARSISWDRKYFILCGPVIFIFKNDTGKRADRVLRLIEFSEVNETYIDSDEIPWPIEMKKKLSNRSYIFAPISERERNKWIECLKIELGKLPTEDEERACRPLPDTPLIFKASKVEKSKGYMKSITDEDNDDDATSDEYEVPSECIDKSEKPEKPKNQFQHQNLKKEISFNKNGIVRELETRQTLTIVKRPLPTVSPKPKFNTLGKPPATFAKVENRAPPIMKISPIVREEANKPIDDGIYEIDYERDQNADAGFWKGSAELATETLKSLIQHEGVFLIRNSKEADGFTLSVIDGGVIRKFPIQKNDSQMILGGKTFNDLNKLVSFFMKNNLPQKNFKLSKPYSHYQ